MNKIERLEYLRKRVASPMPISTEAAQILETLRAEDSELGGLAPCGEVLPPDSVIAPEVVETEDENDFNIAVISPFMRELERETRE